jgi:hypothetical protein
MSIGAAVLYGIAMLGMLAACAEPFTYAAEGLDAEIANDSADRSSLFDAAHRDMESSSIADGGPSVDGTRLDGSMDSQLPDGAMETATELDAGEAGEAGDAGEATLCCSVVNPPCEYSASLPCGQTGQGLAVGCGTGGVCTVSDPGVGTCAGKVVLCGL